MTGHQPSRQDMGASSGSHASHEAPVDLRPTGFDPARKCGACGGDGEYLVPALDEMGEAWTRCLWCHGTGFACNACDPA